MNWSSARIVLLVELSRWKFVGFRTATVTVNMSRIEHESWMFRFWKCTHGRGSENEHTLWPSRQIQNTNNTPVSALQSVENESKISTNSTNGTKKTHISLGFFSHVFYSVLWHTRLCMRICVCVWVCVNRTRGIVNVCFYFMLFYFFYIFGVAPLFAFYLFIFFSLPFAVLCGTLARVLYTYSIRSCVHTKKKCAWIFI